MLLGLCFTLCWGLNCIIINDKLFCVKLYEKDNDGMLRSQDGAKGGLVEYSDNLR